MARKGAKSAAKKGAARSAAAKKVAADPLAGDAAAGDVKARAADVRKRAQADGAVGGNVLGHDLIGPTGAYEDHEGGDTDSLARQGVRGSVPEPPSTDDDDVMRTASIRERQTRVPNPPPLSARSPIMAEIAADARGDGKEVRVIALALGFYNQRRRRPGDIFNYQMGPGEEVLPTWLAAADKSVDTRQPHQGIDGEPLEVTTTAVTTSSVPANLGASRNAGMSGRRAASAAGTAQSTRTVPAKSAAARKSSATRDVI